MRGVTPPTVYDLQPREALFHGVEALRLIPEDESQGARPRRPARAQLHARPERRFERLRVVQGLRGVPAGLQEPARSRGLPWWRGWTEATGVIARGIAACDDRCRLRFARSLACEEQPSSIRRLAPQLSDFLFADLRWRAAEAPGDVVGDSGDLHVGIGCAECRHRDDARRRLPLGAGDHDLRDIGCGRIVDGARAGDGGEGRDRADAGPAVATDAGLLKDSSCRAASAVAPPLLGEAGAGGAIVAGKSDDATAGTLRT